MSKLKFLTSSVLSVAIRLKDNDNFFLLHSPLGVNKELASKLKGEIIVGQVRSFW
jgi:hypothetical protein